MADDSHENGTSNGDVPEIELIIKVSRRGDTIDYALDANYPILPSRTRKYHMTACGYKKSIECCGLIFPKVITCVPGQE
ncbi:hypothetical protein K0M31_019289 [Melipona bicolor]|uniref:Uncharacterized protein n=1 Tax=Melipona bicolor TaxID=60889 RepID=A0AA40G258_9HYME|nr:hypothetical protein K0M31_019289 [Melipona bicolor]